MTRPHSQATHRLLEALRTRTPGCSPSNHLTQIREILASGASARGADVLFAWADMTSGLSDRAEEVLVALEEAGQNVAESMRASPKKAGHPLWAAASHRNHLKKVELLLARASGPDDVSPLIECWMRHERMLDQPELTLFQEAVSKGGRVSEEAMEKTLRESEDTERLLILVRAGQLDPNRVVSVDFPAQMTLAQQLALYARSVRLDAWVEAGADVTALMGNGFSVADQLLHDMARWVKEADGRSLSLQHFRLKNLARMTDALGHRFEWDVPGPDGTTPWQRLSDLPLADSPQMQAWLAKTRSKANEKLLERGLLPARGAPRPRL